MNWFWRIVCEPDCSEACQTNCPGCRALAPEWQDQGHELPVDERSYAKFRWRRFPELWRCWSKSASARVFRKVNPLRRSASTSSPSAGAACAPTSGCGCHEPTEAVIKQEVQLHYSAQAAQLMTDSEAGCCTPALPDRLSSVSSYARQDVATLPVEAVLASLGCGNPLARAELRPGDVVLDLGSGGGMDALIAAGRVAPDGKVYGLDMSEEMLDLARANTAKVGADNVEFLKGDLEDVPLPDDAVDVIISNCVVNLAPDKRKALAEAFRVLRPGGRLAISDIVTRQPVPQSLKGSLTAWAACVGGALSEGEYRAFLADAGFSAISIERGREYSAEDAEASGIAPLLARTGLNSVLDLGFASTSVEAVKPVPASAEAGDDLGVVAVHRAP